MYKFVNEFDIIYYYYYSYPVILSIENHCSVKQQTVMAKHVRSIFGGELQGK